MRSTYKALGHTIAGLVVIQAAAIAFAVFGLSTWIEDGNSLTKAKLDSGDSLGFSGEVGFAIHGILGETLIPLVALVFLVVAFFAKDVPGAVKWAAMCFVAVLVQVGLAVGGNGLPLLGVLHGANAIAIAWLGWHAARVAGGSVSEVMAHQAASAR